MQPDISEVEKNFDKFIDALERGEETEIIIIRNGKPAARLIREPERIRRPLGFLDGKYPPMSLEDLNSSNEEIEEMFYGGKIFPPPERRSHYRCFFALCSNGLTVPR